MYNTIFLQMGLNPWGFGCEFYGNGRMHLAIDNEAVAEWFD